MPCLPLRDKRILATKGTLRRCGSARDDTNRWYKMTRTELIIQLLKVAIGLALGAYFVWWSLQVLDRLTPDNGGLPRRGRSHLSRHREADEDRGR